ncbi:MAG: hypothetical protein AB1466_06305 [Actinomycetota bacterium]
MMFVTETTKVLDLVEGGVFVVFYLSCQSVGCRQTPHILWIRGAARAGRDLRGFCLPQHSGKFEKFSKQNYFDQRTHSLKCSCGRLSW